jgi:hypothetical protein
LITKKKNCCPGEASNPTSNSLRTQSLSAVGFSELPKKLPTPIARFDGTAWHPMGSPEHAP